MKVETVTDFTSYIKSVEDKPGYHRPKAFALGVKRKRGDVTLDVTYPIINFEESYGTAAVIGDKLNISGNVNQFVEIDRTTLKDIYNKFLPFHLEVEKHLNVLSIQRMLQSAESRYDGYYKTTVGVYFLYDISKPVENSEEAYLKLQMLSQRKVKPHKVCLDNAFGKLANIAWTNYGPILPQDIEKERMRHLFSEIPLSVTHVDKFPYMVNYHIPSGVRIASGSQARLGAYLGEGTTVMPAGYVNFNAGTEGNCMIEGRISSGVVVSKNTDIGGGASIMGTLSGGNKHVISIGEKCLMGAMAGVGISLGFGCTIAAGTYVTAGSKVSLYDAGNNPVDISGNKVQEGQNIVKGADLSGKDKLLFLQDTVSGKLICKPNPKTVELNAALHNND